MVGHSIYTKWVTCGSSLSSRDSFLRHILLLSFIIAFIGQSTTKSLAHHHANMSETTTKQAPASYVGTSKIVQTDFPVRRRTSNPVN